MRPDLAAPDAASGASYPATQQHMVFGAAYAAKALSLAKEQDSVANRVRALAVQVDRVRAATLGVVRDNKQATQLLQLQGNLLRHITTILDDSAHTEPSLGSNGATAQLAPPTVANTSSATSTATAVATATALLSPSQESNPPVDAVSTVPRTEAAVRTHTHAATHHRRRR